MIEYELVEVEAPEARPDWHDVDLVEKVERTL
jgi:hypothetical protein